MSAPESEMMVEAQKLMAKLLTRNDYGGWAPHDPSPKEDWENQIRIMTEAIAAAYAKGLEDAAKIASELSIGWDGVSAVAASEVGKAIRSLLKQG